MALLRHRFAQRDQIRVHQLKLWVNVVRPNVVDLQINLRPAPLAARLFLDVIPTDDAPVRRSLSLEGVLKQFERPIPHLAIGNTFQRESVAL